MKLTFLWWRSWVNAFQNRWKWKSLDIKTILSFRNFRMTVSALKPKSPVGTCSVLTLENITGLRKTRSPRCSAPKYAQALGEWFQFQEYLTRRPKLSSIHNNFKGTLGGACEIMFIISRKRHGDRVQILDEAGCISHNTNTLAKGMNPAILPPS